MSYMSRFPMLQKYPLLSPLPADRVVRTSERYAELFRAKMKERRHKAPYPDIYYVLFLANVSRARRVHVCRSVSA